MTKEEIIAAVKNYFDLNVYSDYSDYYVGITNDVDRRLFSEHNVSKKEDCWIWCPANNKAVAQNVEEYFLDLGMEGDTGGGTEESKIVYSYKITSSSIESTN